MATDYDQAALKARLERLPETARVAFAACCSMRLVPLYERYCVTAGRGTPHVLRKALGAAWSWVKGDRDILTSCDTWIERLTALLPGEDDAGVPPGAWAEDALASVIYTLRSIVDPCAQNAVWAAERVINAASDFFTDTVVASVLKHMRKDLDELEAAPPGRLAAVAEQLRARAATERLFQP